MSLSRTQIVNWLTRCGDIFNTESEYLTGLDREIGDADHGLNMNRGFSKVVEKLPAIADKDIGFILKNTGMTLLSSVGGASGPLFGTFFIRAAQATQARLRVYTTHLVSTSFVSPAIQRAAGREVIELPNYIFALNVLYQMGIYAHVDFIRGQNCQQDNSTWERFEQNVSWSLGALNDDERERLYHWYQQQDARALAPASRDWALIWWDSVPQEAL